MNKLYLVLLVFFLALTQSCDAQPRDEYEIYTDGVAGATQYQYFLEQDLGQTPQLQQDMDYLDPNVISLRVGVSTSPTFTITLLNDNAQYIIGIVAVDSNGYGPMGVATGQVDKVPLAPGGIGLRKK